MDKPIKNTVTGFLASTIILSQMSGIHALAMVDSEVIEEEESIFIEPTPDELIDNNSIMDNSEEVIVEKEIHNIDEEYTNMEYEDALLEEDVPLDENINLEEDGYQEYDNNYDQLSFEDLNNFTMTTTSDTITPETTVHFSIEVDYDSPVIEGDIGLDSDQGNYQNVRLKYNDETNRLEGTFTYSHDDYTAYLDTEFTISYIMLYFNNGDDINIYDQDYDFSDNVISIDVNAYENYEEQIIDDVIKYEDISNIDLFVSKNTISFGETIDISLDIESEYAFDYANLDLISDYGSYGSVSLSHNKETGLLEGTFTYNDDFFINHDRLFSFVDLNLFDAEHNSIYLDNDKRQYTDIVIEVEDEPFYGEQVVDFSSLTLSANEFIDGNNIQLSIDIISDANINFTEIRYKHDKDNVSKYFLLERFRNTNQYVGFMNTNHSDIERGYFRFENITMTDIYGNETNISKDEVDLDLSFADVKTVEEEPREYSFEIESLILNRNTANLGDYVEYEMSIEGDSKEITPNITLKHKDINISKEFRLFYDESRDKHVGGWSLDKEAFEGEWVIFDITAVNANNDFLYPGYHNYEEEQQLIFTIEEGHPVPTKPEITVNSVFVSSEEVTLGDTLLISVDADIQSDSKIRYVELTDQYYMMGLPLYYNFNTDKYENKLLITEDFSNQTMEFNTINTSNEYYQFDSFSLGDTNSIVKFSIVDMPERNEDEVPELDLGNLSVSDEVISASDSIDISIPFKNYFEIEYAEMIYRSPITSYEEIVGLYYNGDTQSLVGTFESEKYTENGLWRASSIFFTSGNMSNQYHRDYNNEVRFADFFVEDGKTDFTPPFINLSTLTLNNTSPESGEVVDISLAVESENIIENVELEYLLPNSQYIKIVNLEYNTFTQNFEGEMKINDQSEAGLWRLNGITAKDDMHNTAFINNVSSLSKGNFLVDTLNDKSTVIDIIEDEFKTTYDSKTNTLETSTIVTEPDMVEFVVVTYKDITSLQGYEVSLEKIEIKENPMAAFSLMSMVQTSSSSESEPEITFEGELYLPDGVNPENLRIANIIVYGYNGRVVQEHTSNIVDPNVGTEITFGEVVVFDETPTEPENEELDIEEDANTGTEEVINDETEEDAKTGTEKEVNDETEEEVNTGTEEEVNDEPEKEINTGTEEDKNDGTEEIDADDEILTDNDKAETHTDNNNVNHEENIVKNDSQSPEEESESEKDTDDEKIKQETDDEVAEEILVTDSSTEEEIEDNKLPQTGSSRSTGLIVGGSLSLAAGISLIGSKIFKRKLKD